MRRPAGGGSRAFRRVALILALPLLVGLLYLGWQWSRKGSDQATTTVATAGSLIADVEREGISDARIVRAGNDLVIETYEAPETVAKRLQERLPGSKVTRGVAGDFVLSRPEEKGTVRVRRFTPADSGAGLEDSAAGLSVGGSGSVAIILDDAGFDLRAVSDLLGLGVTLNFAILPNAPHAGEAAELLRHQNAEILCHLPMEPVGFPSVSPGEGSVLTSMSGDEIQKAVRSAVEAVPGAVGVSNHMSSRATADRRVMTEVAAALPPGWYFIDSRTTADSLAGEIARGVGLRTAARDIFLDDTRTEDAIRAQLAALVRLAGEKGSAVGVGHLAPETLKVLREDLPLYQQRGTRFVRASDVVK
ncbi:MAG TPA: divergent polysaccharide deacetylase family protein [Thermoanaerobaculia bacterium]|nr:divergent polysaccharide deacetylase family protein [Thermoanaerobaculia bacterium]